MKSKRILSLLAAAALATTVLVGCGSKEEAKNDTTNNEVAQESVLKDGTYKAESEKDDKGYTASIEIEVKDGKIATVKYDEKGEDGTSKLDNEQYNTMMKDKSGSNPIEAFPALEASLVEKQDAASVDVVTGATASTEKFKTLAEKALADAQ